MVNEGINVCNTNEKKLFIIREKTDDIPTDIRAR